MSATVAKPQASPRLSRAQLRKRWQRMTVDPLLAEIPYKLELNEKGAIEVSPPTTRHAFIQAFVTRELARQRPEGTTFTECPVETEIGVRVPDVVWASPAFMARHGAQSSFRRVPELCVEVLSPANSSAEMGEKVAAYLAAGAREVWLVADDGVPEIYTSAGHVSSSALGFELPAPPKL